MAKLNGVKTVEATNGEITKVAYDGAEYGAIERGGDAKPGDIIRINANDIIDGTKGAFYVVGENGRYIDNDGDSRDPNYENLRDSYDVYRKIEEANAMTTFKKGDVVVTLEKCGWAKSLQGLVSEGVIGKVKAVEGDLLTVKFGKKQPLDEFVKKRSRKNFVLRTSEIRLATADEAASIAKKKKQADEEITFEGAKYRKVDRKAQAGDVIVNRGVRSCFVTDGKPYRVLDGLKYQTSGTLPYNVYGWGEEVTVDVYEKDESKYVPQEGDIVVVETLDKFASQGATVLIGDTGKVGERGVMCPEGAQILVPGRDQDGCYVDLTEVRKATPAEVEAYEKALHKASFSVGDYVKLTKSERGNEGKIIKITKVADGERHRRLDGTIELSDFIGQLVGNSQDYGFLAEQFAKATEQEVADATKPKLKAGDFVKFTKRGDYCPHDIELGKPYELAEEDGGIGFYDDEPEFRSAVLDVGEGCYEVISAVDAKWAKIGRKVGEYKVGDVVEIVNPTGAYGKCELAVISEINGEDIWYENKRNKDGKGIERKWHTFADFIELIAPVESTLK